MQKNPFGTHVSVIVPVKNDSERLRRCLTSLNRLPGRPEIVVVDNGSTDGSAQIAQAMGAIILVCPGLRVGALRNRGVEHSSGKVLAFIDSDHEVPEDWLERGLAALSEKPDVVACGSHYLSPPDGTWVQKTWAIHRLRGPTRVESAEWLGSGNLFVLRSAFEAVGGFREDLVAAEDVDLCHRLKEASGRIVADNSIRNVHHGEPKTVLDFIRKEYWRGSSGLKAWVSQGFPLRDLPSFLWPLWHGLLFILTVILLLVVLLWPTRWGLLSLLVAIGLWLIPSVLLALKTCYQENRLLEIHRLAALYFVYGMTRAVALLKVK
jgi:glycosyltransferase involved in cell wall biosynthesis